MLEQVYGNGLSCYIDNNNLAEGLYKKMGWVDKCTVEADEGKYGVKGKKHGTVHMIQESRNTGVKEDDETQG